MSQAKVEQRKKEKANRKKNMRKEKIMHYVSVVCGWVIALAIVGWAGYSIHTYYENNKTYETVYADLSALDDYLDALDADTEE